ncbi:uncharacterized protein LOC8074841 [Sorghum bicolor]|uniref:Uncharacterized protein 4B n=1 Tax=Sorghum bicolor TaxID=4558 RepID=Q84YF3_SORBI|nr:uncharacterized protein LOC8074841 [Sorghum bicolor]AAO16691.1 hypothetical protein-like protein [Sorghum bicolor]EES15627.1 hypothetical protein SORBI_3008G026400 [Sorghum bicolor]|eukprot:XP_002441789.1 uncharacterized protein LOC8074841 [Sorghum bicolor]
MGFLICCTRLLQLLLLLLVLTTATPPVAAQPQPSSPARALDAALQDYAFRALSARPRTGIVYNATVPGNLTGIAASALRLRSGSLRRRGFPGYFQFALPPGVVVQPHVERVVLVYHDLGDWSDRYYPPPAGYAYLAPVLGLLVYDAANLSAVGVGLPELSIVASGVPISVAFDGVRAVPAGGAVARCVVFDLDGVPQFRDLEGTNVCTTYRQGHISIVVNSSEIAPAPAPAGVIAPPIPTEGGGKKGSSDAWKIAVGVVGGAAALGLLAALLLCLVRYKRDKKLQLMERNAEVGETLRMAQVGRTQAPVALGTRTQPVIENDYAA